MQENGRRANIDNGIPSTSAAWSKSNLSPKEYPVFLIASSAKEAHVPRRLHPNTKQRRRVTGPPKLSLLSGNVSPGDFGIAQGQRTLEIRWHVPKHRPQLARVVYIYVSRFFLVPKRLCSSCERPNGSGVARNYHVSLRAEEVWALRWVTIGLRRIIYGGEIAVDRSRCCRVARSRPFPGSFATLREVDSNMCDHKSRVPRSWCAIYHSPTLTICIS